ncbi:hypothetical protein LSAT2_011742 [Lamellibrachia satsuma]|nr:hypothetical protein LSAT2_011742 [Lamellibrachia satsuma]
MKSMPFACPGGNRSASRFTDIPAPATSSTGDRHRRQAGPCQLGIARHGKSPLRAVPRSSRSSQQPAEEAETAEREDALAD